MCRLLFRPTTAKKKPPKIEKAKIRNEKNDGNGANRDDPKIEMNAQSNVSWIRQQRNSNKQKRNSGDTMSHEPWNKWPHRMNCRTNKFELEMDIDVPFAIHKHCLAARLVSVIVENLCIVFMRCCHSQTHTNMLVDRLNESVIVRTAFKKNSHTKTIISRRFDVNRSAFNSSSDDT